MFRLVICLILANLTFLNSNPSSCDPSMDLTGVSGNCYEFKRCQEGVLSILTCPDNLVWDDVNDVCNYPYLVTGPCSNLTALNQCDSSIDFKTAPGNCSQYTRCINGEVIVLDCQTGLYWDELLQYCNFKESVVCPPTTTLTTTTSTTTTTTTTPTSTTTTTTTTTPTTTTSTTSTTKHTTKATSSSNGQHTNIFFHHTNIFFQLTKNIFQRTKKK